MKLYIWNQPYRVEYGGSFLIVVAPDLESAKERAKTALVHKYGTPWDKDGYLGEANLKDPDRVIENFPYAECYEWSE